MSVTGRGARMTIAGRVRFSLATTSSWTITGSRADQPRMRVWSVSRTALRPLLEIRHPLVEGGGDQADERAADEDAEEGHHQRHQPGGPGGLDLEGARVEHPDHALPEVLEEAEVLGPLEEEVPDDGGHQDDGRPPPRRASR